MKRKYIQRIVSILITLAVACLYAIKAGEVNAYFNSYCPSLLTSPFEAGNLLSNLQGSFYNSLNLQTYGLADSLSQGYLGLPNFNDPIQLPYADTCYNLNNTLSAPFRFANSNSINARYMPNSIDYPNIILGPESFIPSLSNLFGISPPVVNPGVFGSAITPPYGYTSIMPPLVGVPFSGYSPWSIIDYTIPQVQNTPSYFPYDYTPGTAIAGSVYALQPPIPPYYNTKYYEIGHSSNPNSYFNTTYIIWNDNDGELPKDPEEIGRSALHCIKIEDTRYTYTMNDKKCSLSQFQTLNRGYLIWAWDSKWW